MPPPWQALSDAAIRPSVPPGPARSATPRQARHARPGHQAVQTADPSVHGRRSAAIGGGHIALQRDNLSIMY